MLKFGGFLFFCGLVFVVCGFECGVELKDATANDVLQCETETKASSRIFEKEIIKLIECLRQKLLEGIPLIGSLDPLKIPIIPLIPLLIPENDYFRAFMFLTDFRIEGLAGFEISKVSLIIPGIIPNKARLELGLKFTKIRVSTKYRGNMGLFNMFDLFGKGTVSFDIDNFSIDVSTEVRLPLKINTFDLKLVLPTTQASITGLFDDDYMSPVISRQLSKTLTAFATEYQEQTNHFLNNLIWTVIVPIVNEQLKEVGFQDIIDWIINGATLCDPVMATIVEAANKALENVINLDAIRSFPSEAYDVYVDKMMSEAGFSDVPHV